MVRPIGLTILTVILVALIAAPLAENRSHTLTDTTLDKTPACGLEFKNYYTQGQPIVLRLTFENKLFEEVVVDLGYDREGAFQFKLKRGEGDWIDLPQKKVREGLSRVGTVPLEPHKSYSQQIILDDWYTFTDLGKHHMSLTIPKTLCSGVEFDFEITAFDAEILSDFSERLVNAIRQNKNDYGKAADAAKVLARIDNQLVVPFLVKALEANRMVDSIVILALERIGDKQAVRSLILLLEQHDSTSSAYELVRPALVRLEKRSAPEEAETIRIALARFPIQ